MLMAVRNDHYSTTSDIFFFYRSNEAGQYSRRLPYTEWTHWMKARFIQLIALRFSSHQQDAGARPVQLVQDDRQLPQYNSSRDYDLEEGRANLPIKNYPAHASSSSLVRLYLISTTKL